jgi:hypothetical protein
VRDGFSCGANPNIHGKLWIECGQRKLFRAPRTNSVVRIDTTYGGPLLFATSQAAHRIKRHRESLREDSSPRKGSFARSFSELRGACDRRVGPEPKGSSPTRFAGNRCPARTGCPTASARFAEPKSPDPVGNRMLALRATEGRWSHGGTPPGGCLGHLTGRTRTALGQRSNNRPTGAAHEAFGKSATERPQRLFGSFRHSVSSLLISPRTS